MSRFVLVGLSLALSFLAFIPAAAAQCVEGPGVQCIDCQNIDLENAALHNCQDNWALDVLDSPLADGKYEYPATGQGVRVFVVDLGIHSPTTINEDFYFGELSDNEFEFGDRVVDDPVVTHESEGFLPGVNTLDDCNIGSHGTRVASVAGGEISGVAKDVLLHPIRWASGCRSGDLQALLDALRALKSILQQGVGPAVVNLSFNLRKYVGPGGQLFETFECGTQASCEQLISDEIDLLLDSGAIVVASAGNRPAAPGPFGDGHPRNFIPNDDPRVIVVGGVDQNLQRWMRGEDDPRYGSEAFFQCDRLEASDLGTDEAWNLDCGSSGDNSGFPPAIDIWAPAEFVRAAYNQNTRNVLARTKVDTTPGADKAFASGTSFSAPLVAGLIAQYLQTHPNASREDVLEALKANAVALPTDVDGDGHTDLLAQVITQEPGGGGGGCQPDPDQPPVAVDDSASGLQGQPIDLLFNQLFANDDDGPCDSIWLDDFTQPAHGVVRWSNPAGLRYTPDPTFVGVDSFTYRVSDGEESFSNYATVSLTIGPEAGNQAPVATPDHFVHYQGTTLGILFADLLANDFDPDGDAVQFGDNSDAQVGQVLWHNPSGLTYTPPTGFVGFDSFTYYVTDSLLSSQPVTVTIDVRGPNQAPVTGDDHYAFSELHDLALPFTALLSNDSDPEGDALQVVNVGPAAHGHPDWSNPSGFVYRPDPGYVGPDSFTYTVEDPVGATATATVHVEVMAAPTAVADTIPAQAGGEKAIDYSFLVANDSGEALWIDPAQLTDPAHGTVVAGDDPATFRYVPDPGFTGSDQFTYTVEDLYGGSATATVTVTVEDDTAPVASFTASCSGLTCQFDAGGSSDDVGIASYAWSFGDGGTGSGVSPSRTYAGRGTYTVTLTAADAAANSDAATDTVTVDGLPTASFTVSCTGRACSFDAAGSSDDGSIVTYAWTFGDGASGSGVTAAHTYAASGVYTARLTVTDDAGQTAETTRVVDLDLPPVAGFSFNCSLLTCSFNASASSDDLGIASYAWSFGNGTSGAGVSPSRTYATGGSYVVTLTVTDTGGHTASKVKTVTVNRPPVANADSAVTDRNVAVVVPVLANDGDPDGQTPAISTWTQPAHGSVTAAGGGLRYQPAAGYTGGDSFTYRVTDGAALSGWATVAITVRVPNLAPDARGVQLFVPGGSTKTMHYSTILTNDYDRDGHPLSIASFDTVGLAGTLACDGTYCVYTPSWSGFRGVTSFRYTVSDGHGGTDTATVELKVGVTQNDPVAADDALTTSRGQAVAFDIFDLLANDSDADGDVLKVTVSGPRFGSRTCTTPTYDCSYQPSAGFVGFDRLPYTVDDTVDGTDTAGVRVFVAPGADQLDAREDARFTWQNTAVGLTYAWMTANDYDPQGHTRTVTGVDTTGLNGSLTCNTGGCTYQPSSFFFGKTSFRYTVSDGHGETDTAVVTIHVGQENQPPTIAADQLTTPCNVALQFTIFDLLANDLDPETDPLNVTVYPSTAQGGTVTCSTPAYRCTFQPAAGFVGTASFLYLASDGFNNGASATVSIQVQ